jgi:hypothetical protein
MRASRWICGLVAAVPAIIGLNLVQFATSAQAPKAELKANTDDRDELAIRLTERVNFAGFEKLPLQDALQQMSETYKITLLVDRKFYFNNGDGAPAVAADIEPEVLTHRISIPPMKNVRLATVMKEIADQIHGFYIIYPDHIRFIDLGRAYTLIKPLSADYLVDRQSEDSIVPPDALMRSAMDALLTISFNDKPLDEVLKEIGSRSNRTIVIANQSAENKKTPITARFANVPIDRAVDTIAEMAGLKMFRQGNVLLVTTAARAKELESAASAQRAPSAILPISGPGPNPLDKTIEDLGKRVAELERSIGELKQKK